jgi:acyl-CoA oxidase
MKSPRARSAGAEAALLPFAPLLYVAWVDGTLSAAELAGIAALTDDIGALPPATRKLLRRWLDPERPPTPVELAGLLTLIRRHAADLPADARLSLSAAGAALAQRTGATPHETTSAALDTLEAALGVAPAEAARAVLGPDGTPPGTVPPDRVDAAALHAYIDADHADIRARVLQLLATPPFRRPAESDRAAYRARVLDWCARLADAGLGAIGYPREFGGEHDMARAIAVFETLAFHDLSMTVKFGVQFGLFGGSIYMLGTRHHHERFLRAALTLELPGCYAMTETGHGSNVRELRTTAVYDHDAREFIIHTPDDDACKDYIGNAALHGRMASVFAQLEVAGQSHGVHAFLVPLRDGKGRTVHGVTITDCGPKAGLNGVDNGRIRFDQVRIPRDHMLDRFGAVADDGTYRSPIASPTRRFFTMLGTLVAGRISIAAASLSAAKSALTIAIRYAAGRRQFGPEGRAEVPILSYLAVQRALLPRLATTFALDFALKELTRRFVGASEDDARAIEAEAAGLKAYASRHTVESIQACREACGGQGYMAVNRLAELKADTDVFTTFEGANDVLLQLVARALLTDYRESFGEIRLWGAARFLAHRARARLARLNPVLRRRADEQHLLDPDFHRAAFRYREARLVASLARRLRDRIAGGTDSFDALNECQDHALAAARACVERSICERFADGAENCDDTRIQPALTELAALFALARIEDDAGWFLQAGYIDGAKARAIRFQVNRLCGLVSHQAPDLVQAFGIPDTVLDAPIASVQHPNPAASGTVP